MKLVDDGGNTSYDPSVAFREEVGGFPMVEEGIPAL
jgi:hypothetical protein